MISDNVILDVEPAISLLIPYGQSLTVRVQPFAPDGTLRRQAMVALAETARMLAITPATLADILRELGPGRDLCFVWHGKRRMRCFWWYPLEPA